MSRAAAAAQTGWAYASHPGDCHADVMDGVWSVCCRECAGTGVFPVPWIARPVLRDDTSCVACKGSGRALVVLA